MKPPLWTPDYPATPSAKNETAKPETSATYRRILDNLETKIGSWERRDFFTTEIAPLLQDITPEELAAQKDDLLLKAAACNASDVTAVLLDRFPDLPFDTLKNAAVISAEKGHSDNLRAVMNNKRQHPQYLELLLFLNTRRDSYPSGTQQTLHNLKHNYLGDGWNILNAREISKTTHAATASIEHIFNFQAMNVTTIASVSGKSPAVSVTDRNFNDYQSDEAIAEAYAKLALFEKDAPAYRGKNIRTQRRVPKRERM